MNLVKRVILTLQVLSSLLKLILIWLRLCFVHKTSFFVNVLLLLLLFFGKNSIAVAMLSMRTVISKRLEDVPSRTISKTQLLAADELGPHSATPPVAYFKARSFSACTYLH